MLLKKTSYRTSWFPFALAMLFITSVFCQVKPSADAYFEKIYSTLNKNLDIEKLEENLALIEKISAEKDFELLSCYQKGKIYHKVGVTHYNLNQEQQAIAYFKDKVLELWENCPHVPGSEKANTLFNIGISYQYLNNLEQAKEYIDKALYTFETDTDYPPLYLAEKYHGVGKFYESLDDFFRAELNLLNAYNLYSEIPNTQLEQFNVLNDLVTVTMNHKNYDKAKKYFEKALVIQASHASRISEVDLATVHLNAGAMFLELKEYEAANTIAENTRKLLKNSKESYYYSIALELQAMILADKQQYAPAVVLMDSVLTLRKKLAQKGERKEKLAIAYENLSDIYLRKGDLEKANGNLLKAIKIIVPSGVFDRFGLPIIKKSKAVDDEQLIRLIELKSKILESHFDRTKKIEHLQSGLSIQYKIDSIINFNLVGFQFEESKLSFMGYKANLYAESVKDALKLYRLTKNSKYLEEAYYFSSKTKAIILQYEINQKNALQETAPATILNKEKALRANMLELQTLLTEVPTGQHSITRAYIKAQNTLDEFLKEIEQKQPAYFNKKYAFMVPPKLKEIQKKIPKNTAVIEYFFADGIIFSFWISDNSFFPVSVPYNKKLETALKGFVASCQNPKLPILENQSQTVFENLLQPGLSRLHKNINRLYIIPDGELHKLSFEALTIKNKGQKKYLIEEYAISYSYSIGLLLREGAEKSLTSYVGFGTPYSNNLSEKLRQKKQLLGGENLARLTLAEEEIKTASQIFNGKTFTGKNASLQNYYQHSPNASVLHLSLHGLVDMDDPGRSCIVFDDTENDFVLLARNLYNSNINAGLVVLSACHTASGKIYNGEGVQGMSKAFLLSGAKNILSSLWNASELSAMQITNSFLSAAKNGAPTGLALQKAKQNYITSSEPNKRHPYYWANFVLIGELDAPVKNEGSYKVYIFIGLIMVAAMAYFLWVRGKAKRHSL